MDTTWTLVRTKTGGKTHRAWTGCPKTMCGVRARGTVDAQGAVWCESCFGPQAFEIAGGIVALFTALRGVG